MRRIKEFAILLIVIGTTSLIYGGEASYDVGGGVYAIDEYTIDGTLDYSSDSSYDYVDVSGDETFTEYLDSVGVVTYSASVSFMKYGEDDEPDEEVDSASASIDFDVFEITGFSCSYSVVPVVHSFAESQFTVTTNPTGYSQYLDWFGFPTSAGNNVIPAEAGSSYAECTVVGVEITKVIGSKEFAYSGEDIPLTKSDYTITTNPTGYQNKSWILLDPNKVKEAGTHEITGSYGTDY